MSQIDQAFLKAYEINRGRHASTNADVKHPLNVPTRTQVGDSKSNAAPSPAQKQQVFAHAASPLIGPHAVETPPIGPPNTSATPRSASTIHTTSGSSRHRSSSTVRVDRAETPITAAQVTTARSAIAQLTPAQEAALPESELQFNQQSSLQTTRKTLSSYFQQSRAAMEPAVQAAIPINAIPSVAIPSVATLWSQKAPQVRHHSEVQAAPIPARNSMQHHDQAFNASVDRGADFNAWQFQVVERGVKSNSTSDGPSAKIRNPGKPNSFIRIDQAHRAPHEEYSPAALPIQQPSPTPIARPSTPQPSVYKVPQTNPFTRPIDPPVQVFAEPQLFTEPTPIAAATVQIKSPFVHTPLPAPASAKVHNHKPLTEQSAKLTVPVQPTWEVDQFLWPATIAGLLETQSEAIRDIGLHLQHAASKGLRTLAVTSGERGVGRSTISMCIAKAVSKAGLRVALVDCDFECPSLVDQLNLEVAHGWQECILDNVPLNEAAVHSVSERITFFPSLAAWSMSQVQTHQLRINKLLKRIALGYDLVVLDCNRISGKQQTLFGLGDEPVIDAAVVIVDAQLSLRQRVDGAIETLRRNNIQSIGLAENFHSQG